MIHQFAIDAASQETLQNISAQFPKKSRPTLADLQAVLPKPANPPAGVQTIRAVAIPEYRHRPAQHTCTLRRERHRRDPGRGDPGQRAQSAPEARPVGSQWRAFPAGRAAKLSRKRVGKFGWKANIGNLSEFVRVACANELGLGNPLQAQPASLSQPAYRPRGLDLTDQQCDQMTAYIAVAAAAPRSDPPLRGRGRPRRRGQEALQANRLRQLPHSRSGRGTGDLQRFAAARDGGGARRRWRWILWRRAAGLVRQPDFDGGSISPSEWRTPPLWGVADSAPYLHDGRAATLAEAIKLHAGQASSSANRFTGLSDVQQEELIAFLNTLRAPSVLAARGPKW